MTNLRPIVMIIGSCRFLEDMKKEAWELTRKGYIVLTPEEKPEESEDIDIEILEANGLYKIDMADEVLLFNKDGYVGESTAKEIKYCFENNKPMRIYESCKFNLDDYL